MSRFVVHCCCCAVVVVAVGGVAGFAVAVICDGVVVADFVGVDVVSLFLCFCEGGQIVHIGNFCWQ